MTAILAATHRNPWCEYAAVATAGSVIGAYVTFRLARKAGSAYLHNKFGHRKLDAILDFFQNWGTSALAVFTAVPIPMPTSMLFVVAGASDCGVGRLLTVVIICRSARYAFIAIIADHYGRHFRSCLAPSVPILGLAAARGSGRPQLGHSWNSAQSPIDEYSECVTMATGEGETGSICAIYPR